MLSMEKEALCAFQLARTPSASSSECSNNPTPEPYELPTGSALLPMPVDSSLQQQFASTFPGSEYSRLSSPSPPSSPGRPESRPQALTHRGFSAGQVIHCEEGIGPPRLYGDWKQWS